MAYWSGYQTPRNVLFPLHGTTASVVRWQFYPLIFHSLSRVLNGPLHLYDSISFLVSSCAPAALTHKCWTFFEWITSISPNFTKHLRHKNALKKLLRKMDWIIVSWWEKIKISFTTHIRQNYVTFVFSWMIDISCKIHVAGVLLVPGRVPSIPLNVI